MKATYIQRGETIDFKNNTNAVITANDIVVLTNRIGVAATEIQVGAVGTVHVSGVFALPADNTTAFTVGQNVYYGTDKVVATSGDVVAGFVIEPKATADTVAKVKIG